MNKEPNILIVSSEIVPFAKTGGLADVAGALPKALQRQGTNVSLVMPLYSCIYKLNLDLEDECEPCIINIAGQDEQVSIKSTKLNGSEIKVFFVQCDKFFNREGLYQENGKDYEDNDIRFALFSKAVIEMLKSADEKPDVIHCNDWQTGLIPAYLKTVYANDEFYKDIATVFTIHNIAYQGLFPASTMEKIGLPWEIFTMYGVEYWNQISYLKAGLFYADIITTVSPTYAKQIKSSEEFGKGMQGLLESREQDLFGIINGIDYEVWNPAEDELISSKYSHANLRGKTNCKKDLQKACGLPMENNPVIGMVSRLADQKGFDLIAESLDSILANEVQLVILGTGDPKYHELLEAKAFKYDGKLSLNLRFDDPLAHKIYSGSDIFLMPSKDEPCGLGQLIALRYGALPLVFKTGGLADTVTDYNEDPANGNGFSFEEYTELKLAETLKRALELYSNKRKWNTVVKSSMEKDFSWEISAASYVEVYKKAAAKKTASIV
ncbi:MAG: glycogen synthase GlgA [Firmicutes bacterium]|nr:glycogen synthase GlgA [Bacillota bacterium]